MFMVSFSRTIMKENVYSMDDKITMTRQSYELQKAPGRKNLSLSIIDTKKEKLDTSIRSSLVISSGVIAISSLWGIMQKAPNFHSVFIDSSGTPLVFAFLSFGILSVAATAIVSNILMIAYMSFFNVEYERKLFLNAQRFIGKDVWEIQDIQKVENIIDDDMIRDDFLTLVENEQFGSADTIQDTFNKMYEISAKDLQSVSFIHQLSDKYENTIYALDQIYQGQLEYHQKELEG